MKALIEKLNRPLLAITLIILWFFGLLFTLQLEPTWDVAWQHYVAEKILHGSEFYREVVDNNPPLWFWAAIPSIWLAEATHQSSFAIATIFNFLGLALALKIISPLFPETWGQIGRSLFCLGMILALGILPLDEAGQREQAFSLACCVWVLIWAARLRNQKVDLAIAVLIGIIAAYGFALKHYFVLIPLTLEAWLIYKLRGDWRPFRPETLVLAACALGYAAALLLITPHYLTEIVPFVSSTYMAIRSFGDEPILIAALKIIGLSSVALIPIVMIMMNNNGTQREPISLGFAVVALLCAFIVCIQVKGFAYHFIPMKSAVILAALALMLYQSTMEPKRASRFSGLIVCVLIFGFVINPGAKTWEITDKKFQFIEGSPTRVVEQAIKRSGAASKVAVLSTNPGHAFYRPFRQGKAIYSRYISLWMLPELQNDSSARGQAMLRDFQAKITDDLTCYQPDLVLVETTTGYNSSFGNPAKVVSDPHAIMLSYPVFRNAFEQYYQEGQPASPTVRTWYRKLGVSPQKPQTCRAT